jgi:hypothetical protein
LFFLGELAKDKVFSWIHWGNLLRTRLKELIFIVFLGSNNESNNEGDVLVSLRHPPRVLIRSLDGDMPHEDGHVSP